MSIIYTYTNHVQDNEVNKNKHKPKGNHMVRRARVPRDLVPGPALGCVTAVKHQAQPQLLN